MDQLSRTFNKLNKIVQEFPKNKIEMPKHLPYLDYNNTQKGYIIELHTTQEKYQIQVIDPMRGHALIQGGELFPTLTPAIFYGAVCNDVLIHQRAQIGLPFKLICLEGGVMPSGPVKSFYVYGKSGEPLFMGID